MRGSAPYTRAARPAQILRRTAHPERDAWPRAVLYSDDATAGVLMLKVGAVAPEIDAEATDGVRFVLSKSDAACTVVFFYPRAFTAGCTAETENFRDNRAELALAGARIVGISTDRSDTQCRFARQMGLNFPLIADTDGAIASAYQVKIPLLGLSYRVTFVIGEARQIEAVFEHATIVPFRPRNRLAFVSDVLAFVHQRKQPAARAR